MVKFYNYLNESRMMELNPDDAFSKITSNCSRNYKKMFNSIKSIKIYRGVSNNSDFSYIDSNKGKERKSANTENYYTLLVDNLPSWKGWPKRSRGIICSTNRSYAASYGNTFYVIPYDNAKIGVCSSYDMWESFKNPEFQRYFSDLSAFNYIITEILFKSFSYARLPTTYHQLEDVLIDISKLRKGDLLFIRDLYHKFFNQIDIMKHLNSVLDPVKNGFKMGIENLNNRKEVWIQGNAILMSNNGHDMILEELYNHFWG